MNVVLTDVVRQTLVDALYAHRLQWSSMLDSTPGGLGDFSDPISQHAISECAAIDDALEAIGWKL
jgi:hypothetical protein